MLPLIALLFTKPIYSNEYVTDDLSKAKYFHFFITQKDGTYLPLKVKHNNKNRTFLTFKKRIHYHTKETIVTKFFVRLELLRLAS